MIKIKLEQWIYKGFVYNPSFWDNDIFSHDIYLLSKPDSIVFVYPIYLTKKNKFILKHEFQSLIDFITKKSNKLLVALIKNIEKITNMSFNKNDFYFFQKIYENIINQNILNLNDKSTLDPDYFRQLFKNNLNIYDYNNDWTINNIVQNLEVYEKIVWYFYRKLTN